MKNTSAGRAALSFWQIPSNVIGLLLSVAVPLILWLIPLRLNEIAHHALAVSSFMIIAWIAGVIPYGITGMIGCYLFWVLKIAKFEVAFSGFVDQTPWFLLGAMLFGLTATKSGLARRIALTVLRHAGTSYSRLLLGLILTSFLLTFLVPSGIACVVIMASLGIGIMEASGLQKGSNVGRGIFITLTYTAGTLDKVILAGAAVILGRELLEKSTGAHLYWSLWFLAFAPCTLAVIVGAWRLVLYLFPPEEGYLEGSATFIRQEKEKLGSWTVDEKKAIVFISIASALWATDLLHHISPAIIGIGVGLIAATPGIGLLDAEDLANINYLPILFTGGALSMSTILVQTKSLDALMSALFGWMAPHIHSSYAIAFIPYWVAFLYHIFLGNELAMLATSVPPLMGFAQVHGVPALPLGLVWVFAAGGKIFVYQSGVMVTGYSYGYFKPKDLFKVGLCLTILESLVLLLVVPFYWPHLGIH